MESINKLEMGRRIKQLRKQAGLRQWQLAEILGTTQSAVHKYEHGVIPEPRRLVRLAHLGNTTIEWVLTGRHWENGSEQQERIPGEICRLAEKLRAFGPDDRHRLDEALAILARASEALRSAPAPSPDDGDPRPAAPLRPELLDQQQRVLEAALRLHDAVVRSVLDVEEERLGRRVASSDPGTTPRSS